MGQVLAAATSERPGVHRWTELIVYRLRDGSFILAKIGRTTVAHRPDCPRVTRWMVTWLEAGEEARVHRHPCVECVPQVGDQMDPHTILESTRYSALLAKDPAELFQLLLQGRPGEPAQSPGRLTTLVQRVVEQLVVTDSALSSHWGSIRDTR